MGKNVSARKNERVQGKGKGKDWVKCTIFPVFKQYVGKQFAIRFMYHKIKYDYDTHFQMFFSGL